MKVIVHTDNWPQETSWKVTSKCGSSSDPIMSGGPYPQDSKLGTHVAVACVPEGEYEFTIEVRHMDLALLGFFFHVFSFTSFPNVTCIRMHIVTGRLWRWYLLQCWLWLLQF